MPRCAAALQAARFWGGLLPAIRRAAARQVDVVESHWLLPSALAVAACVAPRTSPAHVAHAHSGDVALLERLPGGGALARWLLARTTAAGAGQRRPAGPPAPAGRRPAATPDAGRCARRRARCCAVAAAAPGRRRAAAPARAPRGLDRPVVLAVGRLVAIKGHDVLVRAVARLPAAARPTLVILGEGDQRAALAALARARGVDLRLPGRGAARRRCRPGWRWPTLFVHPSRALAGRTEGQPVAVREALAAGVPVVASASGGIPELPGSAAAGPSRRSGGARVARCCDT